MVYERNKNRKRGISIGIKCNRRINKIKWRGKKYFRNRVFYRVVEGVCNIKGHFTRKTTWKNRRKARAFNCKYLRLCKLTRRLIWFFSFTSAARNCNRKKAYVLKKFKQKSALHYQEPPTESFTCGSLKRIHFNP